MGPGHHERVSRLDDLIRPESVIDNTSEKHSHQPLRIGLTGGVASGKTLVADYFAALGVPVVDTDIIAREVVAPDQPALQEIETAFGAQVIAGDGTLDRRAMREIVFTDDARRRQLEALLHPLIRDAAFKQANAARGDYVVIVVPLLFESPMREAMDRILVVDCREETQLQRLTARDNEDQEQARRIIAAQATREERLSIADDVITNDGTPDAARSAVDTLHDFYTGLAQQ